MLAASCGLGVGGCQPSEASRRPFGYTEKSSGPQKSFLAGAGRRWPGGPMSCKKLTGWSRGSSCNSGE